MGAARGMWSGPVGGDARSVIKLLVSKVCIIVDRNRFAADVAA